MSIILGRAVRHAKDYSTVILVDERYSRDRIISALPKWIQVNFKFYFITENNAKNAKVCKRHFNL